MLSVVRCLDLLDIFIRPPLPPRSPNDFSVVPDVPIASGGLVRASRTFHAPSLSPGQPRSAREKGAWGCCIFVLHEYVPKVATGGVIP